MAYIKLSVPWELGCQITAFTVILFIQQISIFFIELQHKELRVWRSPTCLLVVNYSLSPKNTSP
jgi:hypothetical protein